jgi:hypothetical protein
VLARCSAAVPDLASAATVDPAAEDLLVVLGAGSASLVRQPHFVILAG